MEKYNVAFLQTALDDLEGIVLYIMEDKRDSAMRWHDGLMKKVKRLSDFPVSGPAVPDERLADLGYRMLTVGNYILFYKVYESEREVTILRVLNVRRDYPQFFRDYIPES